MNNENQKTNPKLNKDETEFLQEVAKRIRNIRKIEYHIYQLQKQLHLGLTRLYNLMMKRLFPNYDEHSREQRQKGNGSFAQNKKLDAVEKDIKNV